MTPRPVPVVAAVLLALAAAGCGPSSSAPPASSSAARPAAVPTAPAGLEQLLLTDVPSGLPRVPDDDLDPQAGPKSLDDVAGYATDPPQQRHVLEDYGYRWGWERFWRSDDALTSVFLDQFSRPAGAASYAADLARNDEKYYGGRLDGLPEELPAGCTLLTVDQPAPETRLNGPAAMSWCSRGVFTVQVSAVSSSPSAALAECRAVTRQQLDRLPTG